MDTDELIDQISEHLQEVNDNEPERLKRINAFIDFLMWNKKITELSKEEKIAFTNAMEGNCNEKELEIIKNAPDEKKREYYIDSFARACYFRKCAWIDYLSGNDKVKPSTLN